MNCGKCKIPAEKIQNRPSKKEVDFLRSSRKKMLEPGQDRNRGGSYQQQSLHNIQIPFIPFNDKVETWTSKESGGGKKEEIGKDCK